MSEKTENIFIIPFTATPNIVVLESFETEIRLISCPEDNTYNYRAEIDVFGQTLSLKRWTESEEEEEKVKADFRTMLQEIEKGKKQIELNFCHKKLTVSLIKPTRGSK